MRGAQQNYRMKGPDEHAEIICHRMQRLRTREELLDFLGTEISRYSLHDLQEMRGIIEKDLEKLPGPYKRALLPKALEQVFDSHHRLLLLWKEKTSRADRPLSDNFQEYCVMVEKSLHAEGMMESRFTLLYYLLAAFATFVLEEPGHPVGTPFPGGMKVEKRGETYFCPIRDKEEDVETSICPYCVAEQSEENR